MISGPYRSKNSLETNKVSGSPPGPWQDFGSRTLDIHLGIQRIILNKFAAWFDQIAYEAAEHGIGMINLKLKGGTELLFQGGFPQLLRFISP